MIINDVTVQNLYYTTAHLNVRSGPGVSYSIIGGCYKDSLVDVKYFKDGFSYIGNGRWVCSKYLKRYTDDLTDDMPGWKMTTMYNLNMRTGPGTQYSKIGIIPKDTTVEIIKVRGNWFQARYKNKVFWLSGQYLR